MTQLPQPSRIYQLRLMLVGISPIIWRRLLLSSQTSLAQLHDYIQIAFAWSGEHLHRFRIHGKDYGIAYRGGISFEDNPNEVPLAHFRLHPRESFRYEYDFTAYWRVDIRLEEILSQDWPILPVCTGGRGAAPGEEYAGALAYLQQLDRHRYDFPLEEWGTIATALQRWLDAGGGRQTLGDSEELRQAVERVAAYQDFQPQCFHCSEINRKLRAMGQEVVA
jgi:Plasmid pRiA4b ORF-3-like protein